jgi:hypothetical protein
MSKWTQLAMCTRTGYTLWKHQAGFYQITLGAVPFSNSGYANVEWLVKVKNLRPGTFEYFYHNSGVTK